MDELVLFAQGVYGEDSGCTWMDQQLKDRLLGSQRAKELANRRQEMPPMKEIRGKVGGPGVSDEDFVLRHIMKGEDEIRAMRAAGPWNQPVLQRHDAPADASARAREAPRVRYIQVERGTHSLLLQGSRIA